MPQYIRHLQGNTGKLFDKEKSNIPKNHLFFNPSVSKNIIYLRATINNQLDVNSYIVLYDIDKQVSHNIDSPNHIFEKNINLYHGIEDLRIMHFNNKLWFTATSTHASKVMNNELLIGYFDDSLNKIEKIQIVDIKSLPVKNICPFVYENNLLLLDVYKKCIYKFSTTANAKFVATKYLDLKAMAGINFDSFKGSTSPVHLHGNIWGCVIHDVIYNDQGTTLPALSYLHYWMEFDVTTGEIIFLSSAFWLVHWGIEYVSGIHYDKDKDMVQLFIGVNDNDALLFQTTLWKLRVGK